jgi:hypothetical protein
MSLQGDTDFAWCFLTCSSDISKQGWQHGWGTEFVLSGENQRSIFIWLRLVMDLLKTLFWEHKLSLG